MIPKFGNGDDGDGFELLCPNCGFNYLHHEKVDVFERSEDAESGLHVSVSGVKAETNTALSGNPSARRDGLTVTFSCEGCDAKPVLTIAQHKGQTFVNFYDAGSS